MIRSNDDVMNTLSHYATVTHDNAIDAMEAARRVCRLSVKKTADRCRSSWNNIGGRKVTAAAPRAARGADERRGASSRRRKSVSRAKTAGARRPIRGDKSTSNVLVSLDRWTCRETRSHAGSFGYDVEQLGHDDDVFESRSYAKIISSNGVSVSRRSA